MSQATGNAANNGGGTDWSNLTNAQGAINGDFATCQPAKNNFKSGIWYSFGFSIPTGSTITAMEVAVAAKEDVDNTRCSIGAFLSWDSGSSWTAEVEIMSTTELTTTSAGSYSTYKDVTGGHSWTVTEVNNALYCRVYGRKGNSSTVYTISLDSISIRVTYTPPTINQSITDTITLTELISANKEKNITDTLSHSDAVSKRGMAALAESLALAETLYRHRTASTTDSLALAEALYCHKGLTLADALALAEALAVNKEKNITDTLALAETLARHKSLPITDTLALAESLLAHKRIIQTDALALAEALYRHKTLPLTDTLALAEAILANKGKNITDSITLTESLLRPSRTLGVTDSLSLRDNEILYSGSSMGLSLYTGTSIRRAQRKLIKDRYITRLGFVLSADAGISGPVTFCIRKVSDDSIITDSDQVVIQAENVATGSPYPWIYATYSSPIYVNEEVYLSVEWTGGDASHRLNVRGYNGNLMGGEMNYYYISGNWFSAPYDTFYWIESLDRYLVNKRPLIQTDSLTLTDVITSPTKRKLLTDTLVAFDNGWNLIGNYVIRFTVTIGGSGTADHDWMLTSQTEEGAFAGTGGYPSTGPPYTYNQTITGTITGTSFTLVSDYGDDLPGYHYDAAGTVASDGTVSGTWSDTSGQGGTFATLSGNARYYGAYVHKRPLILTEAVTLAEALYSDKGLIITDILELAELLEVDYGTILKTITDAIAMAESLLVNKLVTRVDAITLTDVTTTPSRRANISDTLTLADLAYRGRRFTLTDTLSLTEALVRNKRLPISDTLSLTDQILRNRSARITDTLTLAESLPFWFMKVSDTLNLADNVYRGKRFTVNDTLNLADAVLLKSKRNNITDTLALAEALLLNKSNIITDTLSLSELLEAWGAVVEQIIADAMSMSETITIHKSLSITDTLSLSDTITLLKLVAISDTLSLSEALMLWKLISITDTIRLCYRGNIGRYTGDTPPGYYGDESGNYGNQM